MALLPDEQNQEGAGEGLEAYSPAVRRGAKKAAPKEGPKGAAPAEAPSRGLSETFSGLRVSLMPSELEGAGRPDGRKALLTLALVVVVEVLVIGVVHFMLSRNTATRLNERAALEAKIAQADVDIAAEEAKARDAAAFNAQIAAVREALDSHVYWTGFFKYLETRTRPGVQYLNFSGDADSGVITLDAVGSSFREVAEQIVHLREDVNIADVRTSSASARVSPTGEIIGVSFTMIVKFKPEVWKKPANGTRTASAGTGTAAPPSPAAKNCGAADAGGTNACFDEAFAKCAGATMEVIAADGTRTVHEIKGAGAGGCTVASTFERRVNGASTTTATECLVANTRGFVIGFQAVSASGFATCTSTAAPEEAEEGPLSCGKATTGGSNICFDAAFRGCAVAAMEGELPDGSPRTFEIAGPVEDGCAVKILQDGLGLVCALDNAESFVPEIRKKFDDGFAGCDRAAPSTGSGAPGGDAGGIR